VKHEKKLGPRPLGGDGGCQRRARGSRPSFPEQDRAEAVPRMPHTRGVAPGACAVLLAVLLGACALIPSRIAIAQTKGNAMPGGTSPAGETGLLATKFEVASIKPAEPANGAIFLRTFRGRFLATDIPLDVLIDNVYHLNPVQLEGLPSWAKSRRYNIQAVMPPEAAHLPPRQNSQLQLRMLQSLLADRFDLKVHWATKILPVYDLVLAKGGPKMKLWSDADPHKPGACRFEAASYTAWGNSSSQIAWNLIQFAGRKVIDKTGLTGQYDFDLTWTPWQSRASGMGGNSGFDGHQGAGGATAPAAVSPGLSIFAAIQQQLGLKLKPARGPVKALVVDHVELPTPN
jgi:uncharacterized protein (TIGR03435 family)